jgi:Fe-S cluster assembly protein SufD
MTARFRQVRSLGSPTPRPCSSTVAASRRRHRIGCHGPALRRAGRQGSQTAHHALVVKPGESLVLLESHEGRAAGYVSDVTLDIAVGEGASVERIILVEDDAEAINVVTAEVDLAPGATYAQTVLTSGARRQRIETRVSHPGAHAQVRLDGVYLLDGQRHADQTTVVTHAGVDGSPAS